MLDHTQAMRAHHIRALLPWFNLLEYIRYFVEGGESSPAAPTELVIRDDLPHIDAMRAGVRLGLTFSIEDRDGLPRLIAHPEASP
jgi:hypothetical protein